MRVYFHLNECGVVVADEDGVELPDVATARQRALESVRDVMAGEVRAGRLCLSCRIDVQDADGQLLFSLPFRDALVISGL